MMLKWKMKCRSSLPFLHRKSVFTLSIFFSAFLQDILEELIVIVSTGGEYQEINGILDCLVDEFKEECAIVERYECNKKLYRYLDNKLKKDKEEFKDKLLKCDEKIFDLENEIKEVEMENTIKLKLVVKWEEARREQTQSMFQEAKSEYQKRIARALSNYEKEERIFNEVELFIRKEIENNLAEKINWKEKYERESSDLDEDIKLAKVKIEKTQDKIQELRENYIRRNIEIQSYLQQKQQMEEARRLEKQKWDSAVRIQAWWRGTMYRNGLGPYRRKKKPKKGGKTGKK